MGERGIGTTQRHLAECIKSARSGVSILFVVGSARQIRYVFELCSHTLRADEVGPARLNYRPGVIQFTSVNSEPERYFGWRGKIEFDHAAFYRHGAFHAERKWRELAHVCGLRLGVVQK